LNAGLVEKSFQFGLGGFGLLAPWIKLYKLSLPMLPQKINGLMFPT
jgi:hypothetical protein